MSTIPPDFTLPADVLPIANELRGELRARALDMAERLEDAGLPADQATTAVVDWLVEMACTMAMAVAISQERPPQKSRWQEVTGEKFDRVFATLSPVIDGRHLL